MAPVELGNVRVAIAALMLSALGGGAQAAPIVVGGISFVGGETSFADDALLVSGASSHLCNAMSSPAASIAEALSGSDVLRCVNNSSSTPAIVEVRFSNNAIENGPGADLVVFELSGPLAPGTLDPRERFGVSVQVGGSYGPFAYVDPVATPFGTVADPTLYLFTVHVDLAAFGVPDGGRVDRLRLEIRNNNLGTRSADIAALGALHSAEPIPEPGTLVLALVGALTLSVHRRSAVRRATLGIS